MSTGGDTETKRDKRVWAAVTVAGVIAGYLAVLLADPRHYYTDDTEAQYAPMWVALGNRLRDGEFPWLIPHEWMAGNYTIEEAGLYNPPQLLVHFLAPSFDNLALYATLAKLVFSIIAALGVYRICLAYGARAYWAAVAGIAFPLSGWFLFFDQASWMTCLTATAWMVHAWASAVRYVRGQSGPISLFVFLYLALTVQYAFPAVESGLLMATIVAGEYLHQRQWRPVLNLMLVSALAASAALIANLPGLLSSQYTWRGNARIHNDPFLTVPWSESLNASLPSTTPAFTAWWGHVQPLPMVYIAWFLIPALAFIDWRAAARSARELSSVALFATAVLMWTAGPGAIGPLRWPARVLPMVALALLVLVCVLLSRHGTFAVTRNRLFAAGCLIGLLFIRSFSAAPEIVLRHLVAVLVVAGLGAAAVWLARRRGPALACGFIAVVMFPIAYTQVAIAPQTPMSYNFPERRSTMTAAFPDFDGVTLQLADRAILGPQDRDSTAAYGSLAIGNYAKALGLDYVNAYTPIGHAPFAGQLCMAWDGSTCPDAFRRAFSAEPETGARIVDLMKVDRVVLHRAQYPDAGLHPAPTGWKWVGYPGHERYIWVLERESGLLSTVNGLVAHTIDATATSRASDEAAAHLRVSSRDGGRVVFARLYWPGYRMTLDGAEIPVSAVARTFLAVDIPAGTDNGVLELTWRPPGWKAGLVGAVVGVTGTALLHWAYLRNRRRDAEAPPLEPLPAELREPEPVRV
ncbi:hypothetical protein [Nocardia goodfellowii]|uniref:YfhO family protein n=1 Tax=Nocardia goodfellowii TaxID=882446 RepID=A0ABS4Q9R4_9NOCA|nr:hypothetical protein [Nocardia goodfellowii]MBP2187451.1 hypothetical protein [Nocardia goodfellowii]